jgi:class 3 adenylate cyclase/tetratricopeptide (TPR) repeat protein
MDSTLANRSNIPEEGRPAAGGGRRCYLTVLFSDLCDSTALSASMEAEDYADILGRLRQIYETVITGHGGTIVRIQGDGVLAVFGFPEAQEGDGRRATEAALDLHEAVRRLVPTDASTHWPSPHLHSGIHSGLVLVQQGDMVLGRLELLGHVPNIASRLSDAAARDEILVSEETLGPESHFFETSPRRLIPVAGRPAPVGAYNILGRALIRTRFEASEKRGLLPLIGRQAELEMLEDFLDKTLAGTARHVAISAPAGVGKTRLSQEFLSRASRRGCRILRGYCESSLSAEPMQPFLQMLRSVFGLAPDMAAADAAEAVARYLDDAGLQSHGHEFLRALSFVSEGEAQSKSGKPVAGESTLAAMKALFAHLLAGEPLVLFIDDWQWADAATRQLLSALRARERAGLFVLLATRGFEAGDASMNDIHVIDLPPFSEREAAQSIGELLPRADPFVTAEISLYSGGNPLFIEELCHSAAHEDMDRRLVRLHGGAAWLNVLVESRVARLPEAQAELVRAAAVVGNVIPVWLLEELTGCAEDHPDVLSLAGADFIFPGEAPGTLRFKHGMTRDVIYDSVGLHPRRAMHLRIAEAVRKHSGGAQDEAYEALAYHYGAGGRAQEAARYAELAADRAVAVSALDRAKAQYIAALTALDADPKSAQFHERWLSIANKLGLVCVFDASRKDLQIFRRAVVVAQHLGDQAALARAQYWLGYINYALGESRDAIHHCELASAAAQGDDPLAVQIRATLGQAKTAACDYEGALPLLEEAIEIKRRHRSGSRPAVGLAFSLVCRGWVLGDHGEFDAAYECFDDASAAVPGLTHEIGASIEGWRSAVLMWQGRWDDARRAAEESTRIAEQTRSLFQFCMGRAMVANAEWMMTRDLEALHRLEQATAWLEPREGALYRSFNHGWLASGLVSVGRAPEGRHHAARALTRGRSGDLIGVATAYRALAEAASAAGDRTRAEHYIDLAMGVARTRQSSHEIATTQLCAAGIANAFGDRPRANALLDAAVPAFDRMHMPWHMAEARKLVVAPNRD